MASPTVRSYSSGVIEVEDSYTHSITMPSSIEAGDRLICFVAMSPKAIGIVKTTASSQNWLNYIFYCPTKTHEAHMSMFTATAYGGLADMLTIETYWGPYDCGPINRYTTQYYIWDYRATKVAYVCYAVSGAAEISHNVLHATIGSAGATGMWNVDPCPTIDDSVTQDYLWLLSVAADTDSIATVAPTDFTNLITAQGAATGYHPVSISVCRRATTGISRLDPGSFTAPLADWTAILMRLIPSSGSSSNPQIPTGGVGTWINVDGVFVYSGYNYIEADPVDLYFNWDGTENNNPFQIYIEVKCESSWTAAWTTGTYFTAGQYSGSAGTTYVAISCNGYNETGSPFTDTLTFTSGLSNDTVYVTQEHL